MKKVSSKQLERLAGAGVVSIPSEEAKKLKNSSTVKSLISLGKTLQKTSELVAEIAQKIEDLNSASELQQEYNGKLLTVLDRINNVLIGVLKQNEKDQERPLSINLDLPTPLPVKNEARETREWFFDVVRDGKGQIQGIRAKKIT